MIWTVKIDPRAEKEISSLERNQARRILHFLFDRLMNVQDPRSLGESLKMPTFGNLWKYRVGDYRIVASIEDSTSTVLVVRVGDRKKVYR